MLLDSDSLKIIMVTGAPCAVWALAVCRTIVAGGAGSGAGGATRTDWGEKAV